MDVQSIGDVYRCRLLNIIEYLLMTRTLRLPKDAGEKTLLDMSCPLLTLKTFSDLVDDVSVGRTYQKQCRRKSWTNRGRSLLVRLLKAERAAARAGEGVV